MMFSESSLMLTNAAIHIGGLGTNICFYKLTLGCVLSMYSSSDAIDVYKIL